MTNTNEWQREDVEQIYGASVHFEWEKKFLKLEGFEKVLGRKFTCIKDCVLYSEGNCEMIGNLLKYCPKFRLTDDTKAEIKLKDKEIEETKIDTHPRYYLQTIKIRPHEYMRLEIIL